MTGDDFDASQLDPGIRQLVTLLRAHNFETTDSGDGASKFADAEDLSEEEIHDGILLGGAGSCAEPVPNVYMRVDPARMVDEAHRLHALLLHVLRPGIFHELVEDPVLGQTPRVMLDVRYSPLDCVAVLSLHGVADQDLKV